MHFYRRLVLVVLLCSLFLFYVNFQVMDTRRPLSSLVRVDNDALQDIIGNNPDIVDKMHFKVVDGLTVSSKRDILKIDSTVKKEDYRNVSSYSLVKILSTVQKVVNLNQKAQDIRLLYRTVAIRDAKKNFNTQPNISDSKLNILTNIKPVVAVASCDHECIAFRQLLNEWPRNKPKAAIYYLTQSSRLDMLKTSMTSVDRYFNIQRQYPIIIFHESDLNSNATRQEIRSYVKAPVFFQLIMFDIPPFINESKVRFNIPCLSHIGYRHMCHFHALGVYQQPILRGLEYMWRLDDDSVLLGDIAYDVFEAMREGQFLYGYKLVFWDSLVCTEGLWPATSKYIKEKRIKAEFFTEWPVAQIYYNNFEISALSVWMSPEYQDYISYIDHLGGIYFHRWGDAPIKSLAVSMFVPRRRTYKFTDIPYKHNSFINNSFHNG